MKQQQYHWPDLSPVLRQYVVRDDRGRVGIAYADPVYHPGVLFAHPAEMPEAARADQVAGAETLPAGAVVMANTPWRWNDQAQAWTGVWCDYGGLGAIPAGDIRRLIVVDDLGYLMPDWVAAQALAGSDQPGYWAFGAALGKVGGEPPVKGQRHDEATVVEAVAYTREVGEPVTGRAIRYAAAHGFIPGARRAGRDWLIPFAGLNHYLDHRPKRGPK